MKTATFLAISYAIIYFHSVSAIGQDIGPIKGRDGDSIEARGRSPNKKAKSKIVSPVPRQRPPYVVVKDALALTSDCSGYFSVQTTVDSLFWMKLSDSANVRFQTSNRQGDSQAVSNVSITPRRFTLRPIGAQKVTVQGKRSASPNQASCRKGYFIVDPIVTWKGEINGVKINRTQSHGSGEIKVHRFPLVVYSMWGRQGIPTSSKGTVFGRTIGALCCHPGAYSLQIIPNKNMKFVNFAGSTSDSIVVNCNGPRRPKIPTVVGRLRDLSADGSFKVLVRKGKSKKATTNVCNLNVMVLKPK